MLYHRAKRFILLSGLSATLTLAMPMSAAEPLPQAASQNESVLSPQQAQLIQACTHGDLAAARSALAQGAQLEHAYGNAQATPLMLAIYRDHFALVQFLIQAGANVETANGNGKTALMLAANGGQLEIVQVLVQAGARLESRDKLGQTPLLAALSGGHLKLARYLLSQGASAQPIDAAGDSAMHLLARSGSAQGLVMAWGRKMRPDGRQTFFSPAMLWISQLYAADCPINAQNARGQTALMLWAQLGQADAVTLLLGMGAQKDLCDGAGKNAAFYAFEAGFKQLAEELGTISCKKMP